MPHPGLKETDRLERIRTLVEERTAKLRHLS
jgi:hypothetical protein